MKCNKCPLYYSYNTESGSGEECAIFGDGWDSPFQYENDSGEVIGCYIERAYIKKTDERLYGENNERRLP